MRSKNKKPELNDEIIHTEYTYNRVNQGKVIQLLDMQFLYQMKDGAIRHCMFDEDWRFKAHDKMKKFSKITQIGINNLYTVEIYSKQLDRLELDGYEKSFTEWRIDNIIPWYDYEISSSVNPYQCGLNYQVHENKGCFTGQEILTRMRTRKKGIYRLVCRPNSDSPTSIASTEGNERSLYLERI